MSISFIIHLLPFAQYFYLMDIFEQEIQKRNYLKLYKNRKYLLIQLLIALTVIAIILPLQFDDKNQNIYLSTLGLYFIVFAFILNKLSIKIQHRPFSFYLRGDNVKWISYDMLFTYLHFILSWSLAILSEMGIEYIIEI